jgi:hypothetical protein
MRAAESLMIRIKHVSRCRGVTRHRTQAASGVRRQVIGDRTTTITVTRPCN